MSDLTKIEWADSTFNPWTGCTKIGPGCDHCYAEGWSKRAGAKVGKWGPGAPRVRTSASYWRQPIKWNRETWEECAECGWRGPKQETHNCCPNCGGQGFDVLKATRQRVFCASLADWLDNEVPIEWLVDLLDVILRTPNLDWLLLTKRIGNFTKRLSEAASWLLEHGSSGDVQVAAFVNYWLKGNPPDNVWLGATVVNQAEADRDIPKLLAIPARVRFLSIEPMLGPIDLRFHFFSEPTGRTRTQNGKRQMELAKQPDGGIHWVICGGESGPRARPMHPDWARAMRDQCATAGVPFLFKQWGEWLPISQQTEELTNSLFRSSVLAKPGEDQSAIDESYGRVCTVPDCVVHHDGSVHGVTEPMAFLQGTQAMTTHKVGKKAAGRLLDGAEHNGFPVVPL